MDFLILIIGMAAGAFASFWIMFVSRWMGEGEREDGIFEVAKVENEKAELLANLAHVNDLLEYANQECHRMQSKLISLEKENDILQRSNKELKDRIYRTSSNLTLITK